MHRSCRDIEIWSDAATIDALSQHARRRRSNSVSPEALEALRILEGTPRLRHRHPRQATCRRRPPRPAPCTSPKAATSARRSSSASAPAATSTAPSPAYDSPAPLPAAGAALHAEGKPVGELTSVAAIPLPAGTVQLALGYIRREALDRRPPLEYPGGTATPIALPYPIS